MSTYFKELGRNISDARRLLDLTQVEVAKDLSRKDACEQSTVSRIESGSYKGRFVVEYLVYLYRIGRAKGKEIDLNKILDVR